MNSAQIDGFIEAADLPSLLAALAHACGNRDLAPQELWLDPAHALDPDSGWSPSQQQQARDLARQGLQMLNTGNVTGTTDDSLIDPLIDWLTGTDLADDYRAMLAEELAVTGDMRVPEPIPAGTWPDTPAGETPGDTGCTTAVAVIGAGMSGILAAHRLRQAGIDCVVLEKNHDIGGTWLENTYPGCRVDVFNHVYSYSGEQRPDWPEYHSSQQVLLDYFRDCAHRWGIVDRIRFGTTVESMTWDDTAHRWHLRLRTTPADATTEGINITTNRVGNRPDQSAESMTENGSENKNAGHPGSTALAQGATGSMEIVAGDPGSTAHTRTETITVAAVVSAVGQLNQPHLPDIKGITDFTGEQFHSSAWRHDIDWQKRRVAVIGTGASALQFIPHLAQKAEHVTVFQRTPPWLIPRPLYHESLPESLLQLFKMVPGYVHWFRLRQFWCTHEGTVSALRRDPDWTGPLEEAVSPRNDQTRQLLTLYLRSQFADRPDLLEMVVPSYPVGAKRVVLDNGIWARTLKRPDVKLVSDPIQQIEPDGVRDCTGRLHPADVIVYGSGFNASEFLMPMQVTGRHGVDLHDSWNGEARAYNGVCVPGFPNLFCIYGPNTNIVVNGSIIYFAECAVHYMVECLRLLADRGAAAMDCLPDAYDRYGELMDAHNSQMAWGISSVNSWYKNASGRVTQNWPLPLIDYWRQTRAPDPTDFQLLHHV